MEKAGPELAGRRAYGRGLSSGGRSVCAGTVRGQAELAPSGCAQERQALARAARDDARGVRIASLARAGGRF